MRGPPRAKQQRRQNRTWPPFPGLLHLAAGPHKHSSKHLPSHIATYLPFVKGLSLSGLCNGGRDGRKHQHTPGGLLPLHILVHLVRSRRSPHAEPPSRGGSSFEEALLTARPKRPR